jgi:fused signal recognition particle receptor
MTIELLIGGGALLGAASAFWYFRSRSKQDEVQTPVATSVAIPSDVSVAPVSFFSALSKSRSQLGQSLRGLFSGGFDEAVREELESVLLSSDVGVETTDWILDTLAERAGTQKISDPDGLLVLLKDILTEILQPTAVPLTVDAEKPFVILMIGVNGVGKTTTIGKLAHRFKAEGRSVLLAAGDTFRAAAVEQLKAWGERNDVPVIAQDTGADSASVLYDACASARARGIDVVLADTAGRLQNKANLMSELEKIGRVLGKLNMGAPHEVILVLDAATGQNAVSQAREFAKAIQPTGIVLTKLDGTAKGGIIFALAREFALPIRFVGLGERAEDLQPFDAQAFVDALFAETAA